MQRERAAAFMLLLWLGAITASGATGTWTDALARMPLGTTARQLNRTNCIELMLGAFRSNQSVKALVFMPGATDEFYMFRRAKAELTNNSPTLLDAVVAVTNQTFIRATFHDPILLLHTAEDPLTLDIQIEHQPTAERVKRAQLPGLQLYLDRDWDYVQPILRRALRLDLRPWKNSTDSWHFYRHNFAGWNLNGWEALQCAAMAGKSRFTVQRGRVVFEPDPRVCANVRFESRQK